MHKLFPAILLASALGLAACNGGDDAEDAVEQTGEAAEETVERATGAADDAAEDAEDAADD